MNKMLNGWVIICLVFTMGLSACGGSGSNSSAALPSDSLTIVSINPASAVSGVNTAFSVEVSYSLVTKDTGMLMIGFNTTAVNSYNMIANPQPVVTKGSGTYTFNVSAIPNDWGTTGSFEAYVNLSENPHPATWSPLVGARKAISFSTVAAPASLPAAYITQDSAQIQLSNQCDDVTCF